MVQLNLLGHNRSGTLIAYLHDASTKKRERERREIVWSDLSSRSHRGRIGRERKLAKMDSSMIE